LTELFIVEGDSAAGCFSSETLIKMVDGKPITLKKMAEEQAEGKRHFVYTILDDGSVGIEEAINARLTKKNAPLVKVTLDNGMFEICTPCHPFMLRDGTYARADSLNPGTSLMPCYSQLSKKGNNYHNLRGYEMIRCPKNNKWVMAHTLADEWNIRNGVYEKKDGHVHHHVDFCKLNNNPTNIIRMNKDEHFKLHSKHLEHTLHRPDVKAKSIATRQTPDFCSKQSETMKSSELAIKILSTRNNKQWSDPQYVDYMVKCWKSFCDENLDYVVANQHRLNEVQKEYWALEKNRKLQSERTKAFFDNNPAHRENCRQNSIKQWDDEFRKIRQDKIDAKNYQRVAQEISKYLYENDIDLKDSDAPLIPVSEYALYQRYLRWCNKYFNGNRQEAHKAISYYNHKVVSVEHLDYTEDVYDLEVPNTHNFALASGIFVHNSAKDGRDSSYQAILPIRGKIINAEKKDLLSLLKNKEIESLITAIGVGIETSGDDTTFNLDDRKYSKIILMTDADVDGSHITTLLLTFFYRYMRPLVENGYIYLAQPPLYRVDVGSKQYYCWTEDDRIKALSLGGKTSVTRFKGLGEMDDIELGDTTMNKGTRRLIQVSIEDAADADRMLSVLMGKDIGARKAHIVEHSKKRMQEAGGELT
jgi:DNA gyrase subunit B